VPGRTCALCGRAADPLTDGEPPLGWTAEVDDTGRGGATRWICPGCTREHVRAMEAKLDRNWW
jgi:hypothetical protein